MIRILRILAPNPGPFTLDGTNTWVLGAEPSVVIDPGPDDPGHLAGVLQAAAPIAAIVLTHHHPDHAPGAAPLAAMSGAPVRAFSPQDTEHALRDGEILESGSVRLRVVHTPGHTRDHIALLLDPERLLFTGDTVLGRGTSVIDPPEGDMGAYVRSLHRLLALDAAAIHPGHGPVVLDARARLREYIDHRALRERQVLEALGETEAASEDLVPPIYGDEVPESMYPAAARSVLAHLVKLEREGRVARRGPPDRPRFHAVVQKPCERCGVRPAIRGTRFCGVCALAVLQERPDRGAGGA